MAKGDQMRIAGSAAEGMMLLGDAVSNLAYGMQLRQDEAFLTDFEVQTAKGLTQNLSDLSQSKFTDLVGADGRKIGAEKLDGYFQKLRDEAERVGQGNPRLGAAMKERIGRAQIHGTGTLQKIESEKFRDYDRAVLMEASALDSQAYASAQNDGERGIVLARGLDRFASRRGSTLTEQESVDHAQKWATQTHVDYVAERLKTDPMIASGSPEQAAKMVADLTNPLKYPFLSPHAKNHIIQLFEATRRHAVETFAAETAENRWPEPGQRSIEVLKTAFMKEHGLTVQQAQNLSQSAHAIAQRTREGIKETENKAAQDVWENAVAPLLLKGRYGAAQEAIKKAPIDNSTRAAYVRDVQNYMKAMKEPETEGPGVKWFKPGVIPDEVIKDKVLFKTVITEMSKIEAKTKPDETLIAKDTFLRNINTLAAQKEKDGEKIYASDIYDLGLKVFTDPAFRKGKASLADALGDKRPKATTQAPGSAVGSETMAPATRRPGESVKAFMERTGGKLKRQQDILMDLDGG
jgi:hypothetical protein